MIISKSKIEDMQIRQLLLEATEACLSAGFTEHAKDIGAVSKQFGHKITAHDYSKEETGDEIWARKLKEAKEVDNSPHPLPEALN